MPSRTDFLRLGDGAFLKRLEFPAVYHTVKDELYEVDAAGFHELACCDGTLKVEDSGFPEEFLRFCLEEEILDVSSRSSERRVEIGNNEIPSLRYLMLEVTDRCNLSCSHCYLGDSGDKEMTVQAVEDIVEEFAAMGGLRLMVTGGEPLLHGRFEEINGLVADRPFRSILITNGTLTDERTAGGLSFQEIQVSLDGMESGHDFIRGNGSFRRTLAGLQHIRDAGKEISVATMVHRGNLDELDELRETVEEIGAVAWVLDVPCEAGRMKESGPEIEAGLDEAAAALERSFGAEQHQPSGEYACGAHLACARVSGVLTKCGFYQEWNGGHVMDGLRDCWLKLPRMRLEELDCDCEYLHDCGGGCRFRAEAAYGRTAPDPLKCRQFGINLNVDRLRKR